MLDYIWIVVLVAALGVPMLELFETSQALRRMYYALIGAWLVAQFWNGLPALINAIGNY